MSIIQGLNEAGSINVLLTSLLRVEKHGHVTPHFRLTYNI